jgi:hypothetical protein
MKGRDFRVPGQVAALVGSNRRSLPWDGVLDALADQIHVDVLTAGLRRRISVLRFETPFRSAKHPDRRVRGAD